MISVWDDVERVLKISQNARNCDNVVPAGTSYELSQFSAILVHIRKIPKRIKNEIFSPVISSKFRFVKEL